MFSFVMGLQCFGSCGFVIYGIGYSFGGFLCLLDVDSRYVGFVVLLMFG